MEMLHETIQDWRPSHTSEWRKRESEQCLKALCSSSTALSVTLLVSQQTFLYPFIATLTGWNMHGGQVCVCVLCVRSCHQAKRGCCSGQVRIVKRFFAKVGHKPKHSWYTVHVNWPIDRSRRGSRSGLWHPWWVHPSIGPQSHVCSTINSLSLVRTWSTVHKRHLMSSNALFKSADNELSELQHRNSATFCVLMDTGQMSNDSLFFAWRWLLLY